MHGYSNFILHVACGISLILLISGILFFIFWTTLLELNWSNSEFLVKLIVRLRILLWMDAAISKLCYNHVSWIPFLFWLNGIFFPLHLFGNRKKSVSGQPALRGKRTLDLLKEGIYRLSFCCACLVVELFCEQLVLLSWAKVKFVCRSLLCLHV